MRAHIEALRCLAYLNAESLDLASATPTRRSARRQELADLLTPITKGWGTDLGVELTSLAVQVHGGMGYIEETGVAQHYRDARIAPIYEGTNGIQAMDLVGRKLPMRAGRRRGRPPGRHRGHRRRAVGCRRRAGRPRQAPGRRPRRAAPGHRLAAGQRPGRPQQLAGRRHALPAHVRDRDRRLAAGPGRGRPPSGRWTRATTATSCARRWSPPASTPSRCCPRPPASSRR